MIINNMIIAMKMIENDFNNDNDIDNDYNTNNSFYFG